MRDPTIPFNLNKKLLFTLNNTRYRYNIILYLLGKNNCYIISTSNIADKYIPRIISTFGVIYYSIKINIILNRAQ